MACQCRQHRAWATQTRRAWAPQLPSRAVVTARDAKRTEVQSAQVVTAPKPSSPSADTALRDPLVVHEHLGEPRQADSTRAPSAGQQNNVLPVTSQVLTSLNTAAAGPGPDASPSASQQDSEASQDAAADLPSGLAAVTHAVNNTASANGLFLEASMCRLYYFSESQLIQFKELLTSMRNSRSALACLAVANVALSLAQASGYGHHPYEGAASATLVAGGLTVGDVAYWADSLMVAGLINYAIHPFERVQRSRSNQMAYTFQGLNRLGLVFTQLSIGSVAVSTVTGLEAAAKYPPLVVGTSAVFFALAVIRSGAMWWTLSRHAQNNEEVSRTLLAMRDPSAPTAAQMSPLDRWATFLAFGYLLQFEEDKTSGPASSQSTPSPAQSQSASATATGGLSPATGDAAKAESSSAAGAAADTDANSPYEFNAFEERLLRGLTESTSTAGLALGLQAFVTIILAFADVGVNDLPSALGNGVNGANKAVMAAILFNACSAYDRAIHTAGTDVEHLMEGLGKKGLTGLFNSLAVLSWTIAVAQLLTLGLPWIQDNLLAKAAGEGLSTRTAESIVKVIQWARAVLRGL